MWFWYALSFAILSSVGTIIAKKVLIDSDESSYIWLGNLFTIPFLLLLIVIFFQMPQVDITFLKAISGSIVLDTIAIFLAFRAVKISEISLINPLSSFNPMFATFFALLFLGEKISFINWGGVLLIVVGAYILQLKKAKKGNFFDPIKALISHKGVRYSILANLLLGITPVLQKTAIVHTYPSTPPFVSLFGMLGVTFVYSFFVKRNFRNVKIIFNKYLLLLILGGVISSVAQISAFMAFSLANLGFVTAIFKLSMIFTVFLGWFFFKEKDIKEKLLGTIVMLLGVTILVI